MDNENIKEILNDLGDKEKYIEEFGYQYKIISLYDAFSLLDYITNLEQVNKNQAKRNSRQRLANQKQQELILKLQQENERLEQNCKDYIKVNEEIYQESQIKSAIIKEARELIIKAMVERDIKGNGYLNLNNLLQILDKVQL